MTTKRLLLLLPLLGAFVACSSEAPVYEQDRGTQSAYDRYLDLSADGSVLSGTAVGARTAISADSTGLALDLECVRRLEVEPGTSVRTLALRIGCAEIVGQPANEEELAAQSAAQASGAGRWSPDFWTQLGNGWDSFWRGVGGLAGVIGAWIGEHWQETLGVVGSLVGILGVAWSLWLFYNKQVHIVLIGSPSAGKTDLWIALKDGTAPLASSAPTSGKRGPRRITPITWGKYTLYPRVVDAAGSEPWHAFDELSRSWWKVRWRYKRVLVVVVAPVSGNISTSPPTVASCESEYISEQKGYMSLAGAAIGNRVRRNRPDLVVLFASKFDLISSVGPADSAGVVARSHIDLAFEDHRKLLKKFCDRSKVRYRWIRGSSKEGWGIPDLRDAILGLMS